MIKKEFKSGSNVEIKGEELRSAGRWIAVVRGDSNQSQVFWVKPGKPGKLNFLARPSRVPVARPNVISGVTFVFDQYQNLILDPTPVNFNLSVGGAGFDEERYQPRRRRLDQQRVSAQSGRSAVCRISRRHFSSARGATGSG